MLFQAAVSLIDPSNKRSSLEALDDEIKGKFDIGIVASFGAMIPDKIIDAFPKGIYVMHPSLLPLYRGACPIQRALLDGCKETGVSIVECSKRKFDAGKVMMQEKTEIKPYFRFNELSVILSELGASKIIEFLQKYEESMRTSWEQNESDVTLAPILKGKPYLNFSKLSSERAINIYRAFYGSNDQPFANFELNKVERFIFFDNLFKINPESDLYVQNLMRVEAPLGALYWNLKGNKEFIFIRTTDGWVGSNRIKFDCTGWSGADFFVNRFFKNKSKDEEGAFRFKIIDKNLLEL